LESFLPIKPTSERRPQ